jgi:anti-anti-sigma regulatory factor
MGSESILGAAAAPASKQAFVQAGNYLNKDSGEKIERECRLKLQDGCDELVVNFAQTELVNSVGVSILLGIIDSASDRGSRVVFSDVRQDTVELFDMLGVTKYVVLRES